MANYKATLIFTGKRCGWTETLITSQADDAAAMSWIESWAAIRAPLLGSSCLIDGLRLVRLNAKRASWSTGASSIFGNSGLSSNQEDSAVLVRLISGDSYSRAYWLRGLPDQWLNHQTSTGFENWSGSLRDAVTAYFDALVNPTVLFPITRKPGDAGISYVPLKKLEVNPDNGTLVTLWTALIGMAPGASVRIVRCGKTLKPIQKKWQLTTVSDDLTQFDISTLFASISTYTAADISKAKAYFIQNEYVPVEGWVGERFTRRKTGRAFFVRAGKSKKRS